jgi:8-oxo-dGTP pyrophosphatase MutT (NUDIX family)
MLVTRQEFHKEAKPDMKTVDQTSAGGVAYRCNEGIIEIAVILVEKNRRWQLPKGHVDRGETNERAALREVREEAGVETELVSPIETIEYWFVGNEHGTRVRYRKSVHFFLLKYLSGNVEDHDHEVIEAKWVEVNEAIRLLAFKNESEVVRKATAMLADLSD